MIVCGLVSAAQHNGKQGVVIALNRNSGRYTVELNANDDAPAQRVSIRVTNLTQLVVVRRLGNNTNGAILGVSQTDDAQLETQGVAYRVAIGSNTFQRAQWLEENGGVSETWSAADTILPEGSFVRIRGLENAAHLNGSGAIIWSVNFETGRYRVVYLTNDDEAPTATASVRFRNVLV